MFFFCGPNTLQDLRFKGAVGMLYYLNMYLLTTFRETHVDLPENKEYYAEKLARNVGTDDDRMDVLASLFVALLGWSRKLHLFIYIDSANLCPGPIHEVLRRLHRVVQLTRGSIAKVKLLVTDIPANDFLPGDNSMGRLAV